jgi:hypothetical protein
MCKFFSFISDGEGKFFYADFEARKNKTIDTPDSHSCLATHWLGEPSSDDITNKYEYCFFTKVFTIDQINVKDDSELAEKFVRQLDIKRIIPQIIKNEIDHPFKKPEIEINEKHKNLLKQWAFVWASVRGSVRDSVGASVRGSVWDSVGASVGASVRASVWDSVWAYTGSFFILPRDAWEYTDKNQTNEYPFLPLVKLWERGLVPSYDGKTWRLHGGPDAKILWEGVF